LTTLLEDKKDKMTKTEGRRSKHGHTLPFVDKVYCDLHSVRQDNKANKSPNVGQNAMNLIRFVLEASLLMRYKKDLPQYGYSRIEPEQADITGYLP